ncbi:MAG: hypothetical protein JST81_00375 [Bacteroidetes bacterium]|nr:hypothetical protein [Bacteroidota bacterium]
MPEHIRRPKYVLLSILLLLLISYPILSLPNKIKLLGGIPVLLFYLFIVWLVIIVLAYRISEENPKKKNE